MTTYTATFKDGTTATRNTASKTYGAAWTYVSGNGKAQFGFAKDAAAAERAVRGFGKAGIHELQGTRRNPKIVIVGHKAYEVTTNLEAV
jgi:hypothetical protein